MLRNLYIEYITRRRHIINERTWKKDFVLHWKIDFVIQRYNNARGILYDLLKLGTFVTRPINLKWRVEVVLIYSQKECKIYNMEIN